MKISNTIMKSTLSVITSLSVGSLLFLNAAPAKAGGNGTDVFHFSARVAMQSTEADPDALGRISARQNQQGNADIQTLDIVVLNLDTDATYSVAIPELDPVTPATWTEVAEFNTNEKGRATLKFKKVGNGNSQGKGKLALPAELTPATLTTVAIVKKVDEELLPVLTADFASPEKVQFLVKRYLSNDDGAKATLRIKANTVKATLRLTATGLAADSDYTLVLNGTPEEPATILTSDAEGRLVIENELLTPIDVLDLETLELWDASNTVVLTTTFP